MPACGRTVLADLVQFEVELAEVADLLQVWPVGLDVPEQGLDPGLVGGVAGHPKRCMIAQAAMNSRVEWERNCGPSSLIAISTGGHGEGLRRTVTMPQGYSWAPDSTIGSW